jgi:hypothetical protein
MPNAREFTKSYSTASMQSSAAKLGLHPDIFHIPAIFITNVRSGISGNVLKNALEEIGNEYAFSRALHTDPAGLNDYCSEEVIDSQKSEIILDTVLVLNRVLRIWESAELANDWLVSKVLALDGEKPADLFDSWEGRRWVLSVAEKIERGEFS